MGVSIKLPGVLFRRPVASLSLPSRAGLVYEFMLGGNLAASRVNLVTGLDTLTQIGAPTYNANSVVIGSGGGNEKGFSGITVQSEDVTLIQIRKKPSFLDGASVFHSPDSSISFGFLAHGTHAGMDFWNSRPAFFPETPKLPMPTHTNFFFQAGVGPKTAFGRLYVGSAGVVTKATATALRSVDIPGNSLGIGGNGGSLGSHEIAYAAMFNHAKDDAEIEGIYNALKSFFGGFVGLTVS